MTASKPPPPPRGLRKTLTLTLALALPYQYPLPKLRLQKRKAEAQRGCRVASGCIRWCHTVLRVVLNSFGVNLSNHLLLLVRVFRCA